MAQINHAVSIGSGPKSPGNTGLIGVPGYSVYGVGSSPQFMRPYDPTSTSYTTDGNILFYDFMAYDLHTWISDYNYTKLYKALVVGF